MKQVVQSYRTGELQVADVPAPQVLRGCVLVQTRASLVSAGTERMVLELARKSLAGKARERPDLVQKVFAKVSKDGVVATARAVMSKLDEPLPLGYSATGTVVSVGTGAVGLSVGDRVACAGAKAANHAELNVVPVNLCAKVPDGVIDEHASFATLGAIAMQGVRTAELTLGERVGIIGLGLLGQLAVQLCRASGCKVVGIDLDSHKVELARSLGADLSLRRDAGDLEETISGFTQGRGLDAVIICAAADSNDPIELAGALSRDRGRVVVVGAVPMNVPRRPYYDKELRVLQSRSYGPGRYDVSYEEKGIDYPFGYVRWTEGRNLASFLELCESGAVRVEKLITHRYAIAEAEKAYELISGEVREPFLGIVLTYPAGELPASTVPVASPRASSPGASIVAVVGAGAFAGSVLLPELARRKDIRLGSVISARGVSARHFAEKFSFAEASTDTQRALEGGTANAVVIATRHDLHARQAAAALSAGKAVFLEKPLAIDRDGVLEVSRAASHSGQLLMVDFNRRFAPTVESLRTFFRGRQGPMLIEYRVNAGPLPRDSWIHDPAVGGGRMIGEGCHFVDLCAAITGSEIVRLHCAGVSGSAPADDQWALTLSFADGSLATILYLSSGEPSLAKERIEVHCEGSSAVIDDFKSFEGVRRGKTQRSRSMVKDKGHAAALDAFFSAIRGNHPPPISLRSLVSTTMATLLAVECIADGKAREVAPEVDAVLLASRE